MTRIPLASRRPCETFCFVCNGLQYTASIGRFPDGRLAEIFLQNSKPGSQSDFNSRDAAVVASLALQHSVPLEVIRRALLRDAQGRASTPLGVALDLIAAEKADDESTAV
jgi:hypothetical protein